MDSVNPRLKTAYEQLQKSFRIVKQCSIKWKDTITECQGEIDSLKNLTEQHTCCKEADTSVFLQQLPDVKEKLLFKISTEINKKIVLLHNKVKSLKDICDRISKQYGYSLSVSQDLPIGDVTMATEMIPAISEMVEWLNDAELIFFHQYCAKKYLLDNFDVLKFENDNFIGKWNKGNKETTQKLEDVLCYVQFLIDDT